MKIIIVKFVPETATRPARWSVTSPNGSRKFIPEFDPCATDRENVTTAARLAGYEPLAGRVGWHDSAGWLVEVAA